MTEASRVVLWAGAAFLAVGVAFPLFSQPTSQPEWIDGPDGDSIRSLIDDGWYPEAEAEARLLLKRVENATPQNTQDVADAMDLVVESLIANGLGRIPSTRTMAERAVSIRADNPANDIERAVGLTNLGTILKETGDLGESEKVVQEVLSICEQARGISRPTCARAVNQLGSIAYRRRQYDDAAKFFERGFEILEAAPGPPHPETIVSLTGLGSSLYTQGQTVDAEARMQEALLAGDLDFGADHPNLIATLHQLARMRSRSGRFDEAEQFLRRALQIGEARLGSDNVRVGQSLNSLATVLRTQGKYAEARQLLERALRIWSRNLEPNDPWISGLLNNLANVHNNMGDFAGAQQYLERALAIREENFGADHPAVAQSLSNLANVLVELNQQQQAIPLLRRSVEINRKYYGPESVKYAKSLANLGEALRINGDLDQAEPLLRSAMTIFEKELGTNHQLVGNQVNNLAMLSFRRGDLEAARVGFARAIEIWGANGGDDHPLVNQGLYNLARVTVDSGNVDAGVEIALRAERRSRAHLQMTARTQSEREALAFAQHLRVLRDLLLNLVGRCTDCTAEVWDSLIHCRGSVLNELAQRRRAVSTEDETVVQLLDALKTASDSLAKLGVRGRETDTKEAFEERLSAARREVEKCERALAEASSAFRRDQHRANIGFDHIAVAVPPGAALVSFARVLAFGEELGALKPRDEIYVALVLSGAGAEPRFISLGPASKIDALVRRWQAETGRGRRQSESEYRTAGEALRKGVWDPVAALFEGSRTVFIVPDGTINMVNFAALPVDGGRYLLEQGPVIHVLSEERDLVPLDGDGGNESGLLVVGNPDFDWAGDGVPLDRSSSPDELEGSSRATAGCDDLGDVRFRPLPSTALEVERVLSLWQQGRMEKDRSVNARGETDTVVRLEGRDATEAAVKRLAPGKTVLHLATHGFVLGGRCRTGGDRERGIGGLSPSQDQETSSREVAADPLRLSGLALARANLRDFAAEDAEDGILTATEIANLDLSGVEWAVLSACDTGLGENVSGEGVFGFRRAFRIAGARTVIMSLWPVDDSSGQEWMEALYRGRYLRGMNTAEAVRHASLECLHSRRERKQSTHPFYWGAFVAAGDWR